MNLSQKVKSESVRLRYGRIHSLRRKKKKYTVPKLKLKGDWLRKLGFHEGEYIEISASNRQLIIKPI